MHEQVLDGHARLIQQRQQGPAGEHHETDVLTVQGRKEGLDAVACDGASEGLGQAAAFNPTDR